jgi:hypothetical protein
MQMLTASGHMPERRSRVDKRINVSVTAYGPVSRW